MKAQKLNQVGFNRLERRSVATLASVYGLRMFGLFLILPVLALYAQELDGATPVTMGIALGIYGISQAVFQIPFGALSDRFGRKPIIYLGLVLFILGSLVAAFSETINGVIFGRALQGSGAIAAVVMALTSDLTRENQRTKAMAFIGMSIGFAFMLALVLAPWLSGIIGVPGLFIATALLAAGSIFLIAKQVPSPARVTNLEVKATPRTMLALLKNKQLLRLDAGIFILHLVLTAMFVVVPIMFEESLGMGISEHWRIYVPALLASVLAMIPLIILSARGNYSGKVFLAAVCILMFAQILLSRGFSTTGAAILCLFTFFWGFNVLEAMLPSLVSRLAPAATKGSAMGVYNTFQFLGVFTGGLLGGVLYGSYGVTAVFVFCGLALLLWAAIIFRSEPMDLKESLAVNVPESISPDDLNSINGVFEVVLMREQGMAYLKIDKAKMDFEHLNELISQS